MSLPRCGIPDITATPNPNPNPNGLSSSPPQNYSYFPGNPKWSKFTLTYRVTRMPSSVSVSQNDFKQALRNAFNTWGQNNSFTFTETTGQSDIVAGFHRGLHFDFYPFDGRGGVLAHAFAPDDGRMHMDADGHSNDPNAVMAPTYAGVRRTLRQDDKDGLNNLYGF
ncbi:hypothetical protein LR48_Vigan203s000900 [Vigna angularis]|uniref:Peptidase metallopeptidase domain-containing protein n=1 Tax=Phaseolus angularis TaxID=3914 RepID=A0A0L9T5K9_PHAAN|nr:hypothetical protein LR48_Vigan203s000900 [Vigna angularis]